MKYPFRIVDVFSPTPFGGHQLAVLPDASGCSWRRLREPTRRIIHSTM
jgi:predicted PhzF superfamily epimerase YddE/YHI9